MLNVRKAAAAAFLLGALSLGGCAGQDVAAYNSQVDSIRAQVKQACSFVPTVTTVINLLSAFVPAANTVVTVGSQIADAICVEARKGGASRAAARDMWVQGVKIEGQFVAR